MDSHIPASTWETIYKYLRSQKGLHTQNEAKLRLFIEGVWYVLRTSCQWRLLPQFYGHWRCLHQRFIRWHSKGLWQGLLQSTIDADLEVIMIDALVDALGNPLKFILSPGHRHDIKFANSLLEGVKGSVILADKAYDCQEFISFVE